MNEMITWLRAQLDTDELEATHGWEFIEENSVRGPGWGHAWCRACGWESFGSTEPNAKYAWSEHATQMHNPARALRQVQAHRVILNEHEPLANGACNTCSEGMYSGEHQTYPCRTIKTLVSIYSDRDGYRAEWSA